MRGSGEAIQTEACIHVRDMVVRTENISQEERVRWATKLKARYLNELFSGKLHFAESEGFVKIKGNNGQKSQP
jgi:predicted metal-binding transcription factor (methanogenesis marker protein 9)